MENEILNCPICDSQAHLLDVVDFNKNCEEVRGFFLPISGVPIYYAQCQKCYFSYAPEFANWKSTDFLEKIYNDKYIDIDPDYLEKRPLVNFGLVRQTFAEQKKLIKHLDYGGGNGALSNLLRLDGFDSQSYDPFYNNRTNLQDLGKFNLITVFEVFEHVPNANMLMKDLINASSEDCLILFSTLISDGNINKNNRLDWWYASPRNGHISLFSSESLIALGLKNELNFVHINNGMHIYYKNVPKFAKHIFTQKTHKLS